MASPQFGTQAFSSQLRGSRRRDEKVQCDTFLDDRILACAAESCRANADCAGTQIARGDAEPRYGKGGGLWHHETTDPRLAFGNFGVRAAGENRRGAVPSSTTAFPLP